MMTQVTRRPMIRLQRILGGRDFFHLLRRAADNVSQTAQLYQELVELFDDPGAYASAIFEREQRGDELTHDILHTLARRVVAPIDHDDIHELATRMDDVVDAIEEAADQLVLFRIDRPTERSREQATALAGVCEIVAEAVGRLPNYAAVKALLPQIHEIESRGDRIFRRAIAELYEGGHEALHVLKWNEIYHTIEDAIDGCKRIAAVLEGGIEKRKTS